MRVPLRRSSFLTTVTLPSVLSWTLWRLKLQRRRLKRQLRLELLTLELLSLQEQISQVRGMLDPPRPEPEPEPTPEPEMILVPATVELLEPQWLPKRPPTPEPDQPRPVVEEIRELLHLTSPPSSPNSES